VSASVQAPLFDRTTCAGSIIHYRKLAGFERNCSHNRTQVQGVARRHELRAIAVSLAKGRARADFLLASTRLGKAGRISNHRVAWRMRPRHHRGSRAGIGDGQINAAGERRGSGTRGGCTSRIGRRGIAARTTRDQCCWRHLSSPSALMYGMRPFSSAKMLMVSHIRCISTRSRHTLSVAAISSNSAGP
jgi:hypothetical protein